VQHLNELPIELSRGDILDPASVLKALDCVHTVFHAAAVYDTSSTDASAIVKTAVEGTTNLFEAAARTRPKQIVYTSSVVAVGRSRNPNILLDETYFSHDFSYPYYRAKIESEELATELAAKHSLPTVFCLPAVVLGGGDYKVTPSNRMLLNVSRRPFACVDGGACYVHVEDVATGHLLASEKGKPGERYILGGDNLLHREFAKLVVRAQRRSVPVVQIPTRFLHAAATVGDMVERVTHRPMPLTHDRLEKAVGRFGFYDLTKARRELGYSPRGADAYLAELLEWLHQHAPGAA